MPEYSVAFTATIRLQLERFLIREDGQEDVLFGLCHLSRGLERQTALLYEVLFPIEGERQRHGNASFNAIYFERALDRAIQHGSGVVLLHSHPGPGWQGMSRDDIRAEEYLCSRAMPLTGLPLVGLTVGSDGIWSGRVWTLDGTRPVRHGCTHVRSVGKGEGEAGFRLKVDYDEQLRPLPMRDPRLQRTRTVWGEQAHADMTRLTVGIVGLGSVGSQVLEHLARSGFTRVVLIDYDRVEIHNLDRLTGVFVEDVGQLKVDVLGQHAQRAKTSEKLTVRTVAHSVVEAQGYRAALDCDVLFSCVDRPRARRVLDHLAYMHLIPVIDGGIRVRFRGAAFSTVNWQLQTVGPGKPCLACLGCYDPMEAEHEALGLLEDPQYIAGLPPEQRQEKQGENVFTFSANLASLEMLHLVALSTGVQDFGVQRYDFQAGMVEAHLEDGLPLMCLCKSALIALGDHGFTLEAEDFAAQASRVEREKAH